MTSDNPDKTLATGRYCNEELKNCEKMKERIKKKKSTRRNCAIRFRERPSGIILKGSWDVKESHGPPAPSKLICPDHLPPNAAHTSQNYNGNPLVFCYCIRLYETR
jgi:hypothetical protein